jgi:hypothetical protein
MSKLNITFISLNKTKKTHIMEKSKIGVSEMEMVNILMGLEKPTFTNILSKIKVRMNKTGNPYHERVFKTTEGNYFIGGDYEKMVNNQIKKEDLEGIDFKSQECKVGNHVSKCILYNEKLDTYYLQHYVFKEIPLKSTFEFEGNEIEKQMFESYMVKKSENKSQPQERKIFPPSFKMSSILEISLNGNRYVIER